MTTAKIQITESGTPRPAELTESARQLFDEYRAAGLSEAVAMEVALQGGTQALEMKRRQVQADAREKVEETATAIATRRAERRIW